MASGSLRRVGEPEEMEAWKVMMDSMVKFIAASTKLMNTLNTKAGNNSTIMSPVQILCEDECKQCLPEKTPKCAAVSCLQASKMNDIIALGQAQPQQCAAEANPETTPGDANAAAPTTDAPQDKKEGDNPAEGENPEGEAAPTADVAPPDNAAAPPADATPQTPSTPAADNSDCVCKTVRDQRAAGIESSGKKGKCSCSGKKKKTPSIQQLCACPITPNEKDSMVEAFMEKVNRAEQEVLELRQQLQQMMEMDKSRKSPSAALYKEIMKDSLYPQSQDSQGPPGAASLQRKVCRRPESSAYAQDIYQNMPPPRRYPVYGRTGGTSYDNAPNAAVQRDLACRLNPNAAQRDLTCPLNLPGSTPVGNRGNVSYKCPTEGEYSYPDQDAPAPDNEDYSFAALDTAFIAPSTPAPNAADPYSYPASDAAFSMPPTPANTPGNYRTPVGQGPYRNTATPANNSADYRTPVGQGPYRNTDYATPGTSQASLCICPSEQNQQPPSFYGLYESSMSTNIPPQQQSQAYNTQTSTPQYPQNYVECLYQSPRTPQRTALQTPNTAQSMRTEQQYNSTNRNQIARTADQNIICRSRIPTATGPQGYLPQRNPLAQMLAPQAFSGFQPRPSALGQTILSVQGITICRTNENYDRFQDAANLGQYQIQNGEESCTDNDCENSDCEAHSFG